MKQRINVGPSDTADDEMLLEFIEQVSADITSYCERWFVRTPRSGTDTFLLDVDSATRVLKVPQGIASLTQLEVADDSQPESGGTYTVITAADALLRPGELNRLPGWPATEIWLTDNPAGSVSQFNRGYNSVRITGALGFPAVPADIQSVAATAVVRKWQARQSGQSDLIGSNEFGGRLLRWISPEERETLDRYRRVPVG